MPKIHHNIIIIKNLKASATDCSMISVGVKHRFCKEGICNILFYNCHQQNQITSSKIWLNNYAIIIITGCPLESEKQKAASVERNTRVAGAFLVISTFFAAVVVTACAAVTAGAAVAGTAAPAAAPAAAAVAVTLPVAVVGGLYLLNNSHEGTWHMFY